jgi:16S rRNA (guanine(966)-N(2))-methyltransferase RsmD
MRVIAGKYRSRRLQSLRGLALRPTADRMRETLFNVLCAGNPSALEGTVWVDFFAGSGAVGIEALSRGAAEVIFVEASPEAVVLIERNLRSLGISSGFRVLKTDVIQLLGKLGAIGQAADFVFLDPPYRMQDAYRRILTGLGSSGVLRPSTLVIAEHDRKFDPGGEFGAIRRYRTLQQGDRALSFYARPTLAEELPPAPLPRALSD